jgi:hypothetical protein
MEEESVVVIKLISGEEIVGTTEVTEDDGQPHIRDLLIKHPLRLVTMPQDPFTLAISLMKFMPYTETDVFTVSMGGIVICEPAAADLVEYYNHVSSFYQNNESPPEEMKERHMQKREEFARHAAMHQLHGMMEANTSPNTIH